MKSLATEREDTAANRGWARMLKSMQQHWQLYLFVVPIVAHYILFSLYPIVRTCVSSFFDAKIHRLGDFVGTSNYIRVLSDRHFTQALTNTLVLTLGGVGLILVLSLTVAVLINSRFVKFKTFFKVIYFLPVVTSPIAVGYIWKWLYNPSYGIINLALSLLGFSPANWLGDIHLAMGSLIITDVWMAFGYYMVIFLANLQIIDPTYYEVASIDGAGSVRQFFSITLPLLRRAVVLCLTLGIVFHVKGFSLVIAMTNGAPAGRTELMATYLYKQAFGTGLPKFGYSAAGSMVLFVIIMLGTLLSNRLAVKEI